jgi:hypothetical protein
MKKTNITKKKIWKDSEMLNFVNLVGPFCCDSRPHSIMFHKIQYNKKMHFLQ